MYIMLNIFPDITMRIAGKDDMISDKDNKLPNPLKFPGKLNQSNKSGTLLSK